MQGALPAGNACLNRRACVNRGAARACRLESSSGVLHEPCLRSCASSFLCCAAVAVSRPRRTAQQPAPPQPAPTPPAAKPPAPAAAQRRRQPPPPPPAGPRIRSSPPSTASRSTCPSSRSPSRRCRRNTATCRCQRLPGAARPHRRQQAGGGQTAARTRSTTDPAFKKRMAFVEEQVIQDFWLQREIAKRSHAGQAAAALRGEAEVDAARGRGACAPHPGRDRGTRPRTSRRAQEGHAVRQARQGKVDRQGVGRRGRRSRLVQAAPTW